MVTYFMGTVRWVNTVVMHVLAFFGNGFHNR